MHRVSSLVLVAALGASGFACSSEPPRPKTQTAAQTPGAAGGPQAAATPKNDTATPSSGSVAIDDKIMRACGDLPTAHFAFDSTSIAGDAAAALDALARCFVTGPLKGKGMRLVGHADPRGEVEYNLALGQQRAGSVGGYLSKKGLAQDRIATSSRGEFDASGTDEEGWARDRKVEVFLAD